MRSRRMNVRLVCSAKMDEIGTARENGYVRVAYRARSNFSITEEHLTLEMGSERVVVRVKPAYKNDVTTLRREVEEGLISEEEAVTTGFITSTTLNLLSGGKPCPGSYGKDCFLSDSVEDLTIGADPEFALVDSQTKRFKYASYIIPQAGELGSDGPLAEVRPPPSTNVVSVVDSIASILKSQSEKIAPFMWVAGATYESPNHPEERIVQLGGHIHIGDPTTLPADQKSGIYSQIIRILDELIAIPLVRIDFPNPHLRRNTEHKGYGKYGQWGDQRPQEGRFEWRVPSGLWLAHPVMAQAVLTTTKALSETCYQMMADKGFDDSWICGRVDRKGFLRSWGALRVNEARKLINNADPDAISATLINRAAKKLRSMENYSRYKEEIDEFLRLVRLSDNDRKAINLDMKSTWLENGQLIQGE